MKVFSYFFCVLAVLFVSFPEARGNDQLQAPTAEATSGRQTPPGLNDRDLRDSTLHGADDVGFPGSPGGPVCGDPTAPNFGQPGACLPAPCPARPADDVRSNYCPAGQAGSIVERRSYTAQPAPTCWSPGAWMEVSNTCAPTCTTAEPAAELRTVSCPAGQTGSTTERRTYAAAPHPTCWQPGPWTPVSSTCASTCLAQPGTETRTVSCPAGWTGSRTERRTYTAAAFPTCWTAGPWTVLADTCAPPTCPAQPASETRTVACPSGQIGSITETRTYTSAPHPTCWTAGAWTQTSNTCVAACPAAPTSSRNVLCPIGQSGGITETRTVTAAPAPTCWITGPWTQTSNTCCPSQPTDDVRLLSCPSGQTGQIAERRTYSASPAPTCWTAGAWTPVNNTCVTPTCPAQPGPDWRTVSCPPGQTGDVTQRRTYTASAYPICWVAGAWWTISSNCEDGCGPRPAGSSRTVACPSGQTGSITEVRTYTSAEPPTCWVLGPWTPISNTCETPTTPPPPPASCGPAPAPNTRTVACPSGQTGSITETQGHLAVAAPTCWTLGLWTQTSNTCANAATCGPQPAAEERTLACPLGFTGTGIRERRVYTSAAHPTCWVAGSWTEAERDCRLPSAPDLGCGSGNAAPSWRLVDSEPAGGACPSGSGTTLPSTSCTKGASRTVFSCRANSTGTQTQWMDTYLCQCN